MGKKLPDSRPQRNRSEIERYLTNFLVDQFPVRVVGIRGYYRDTMGKPGVNDINVYDDAFFIIGPGHFSSWNGNTDPSRNANNIATLKAHLQISKEGKLLTGTSQVIPYIYKIGLHNMKNPYEALRQHGRVTVLRSNDGGKTFFEDTDTAAAPFYIDIHKGGIGITSSLGCQTLPPVQWDDFLFTVKKEIKKSRQTLIPYALIEQL